jgi:hypothetical protein
MNMPTVIRTRQPSTVMRRPTRSARPPRKIEPAAMPMSSIDSTRPSVALSMCHSFWIPMEAKLMDMTSNPSRAFRPTAMNTTMICSMPMGELRMVWRGSLLFMDGSPGHSRPFRW